MTNPTGRQKSWVGRSERVVEEWWCPVCGAAAHRTNRPGRPKLYCSNACRQRAYRWRREHCARAVSVRDQRPPLAIVPFGRRHALRSQRDFMSSLSDRRDRRPTVCGALARPSTQSAALKYHLFLTSNSRACRRCTELVMPPVDPRVTIEVTPPGPPLHRLSSEAAAVEFVGRLEPDHPLRRDHATLKAILGAYAPRPAA
jgi:hypothetical protein